MRALGLAVDMPSKRRPAVRAVLLEDSLLASARPALDQVTVVDMFEVPTTIDDLASQVAEISATISGRVRSLNLDAIVIRRADKPQRPNNLDGPRFRLLAEGAVTAAARLIVPRTTIRTGQECGAAYGSKKETLDADAKRFVTKLVQLEAAAAALTALTADRT